MKVLMILDCHENAVVKAQILAKYMGSCLRETELKRSVDLRQLIEPGRLLQNLLFHLGIQLHEAVVDRFDNDPEFFKSEWPIKAEYIRAVNPTVQTLGIGTDSSIQSLFELTQVSITATLSLPLEEYPVACRIIGEAIDALDTVFDGNGKALTTMHTHAGPSLHASFSC
jgi:hypothetical protein